MTTSQRRNGRTRPWLPVLLGTIAAAFGYAGQAYLSHEMLQTRLSQADMEAPSHALTVSVQTLVPVTAYQQTRLYPGIIRPARRVQLAFERSARLTAVHVDEGQSVSAGQVLAEIDARRLRIEKDELNARHQQQSAILAELTKGPRSETIAAAQAELSASDAQVRLQQSALERNRSLLNRGAGTSQEVDDALLLLKAAQSRRDAVAKRLEELLAGTRAEQIQAQEASLAMIDAQRRRVQTELDDSFLKAPFAGRVVRRMVDEGDLVSAQQFVLELIEDMQLEAHVGIPTEVAVRLNPGSTVELSVNGNRITGFVRNVVAEVRSETRTQTVIIDLHKAVIASQETHSGDQSAEKTTDPLVRLSRHSEAVCEQGPDLYSGQLIQLEITETEAVSGFRVPLTALTTGTKGLWNVYVIEPSDEPSELYRAVARPVEMLHSDEVAAIVRGAIFPQENVIISSAHRISPGQIVHVADDISEDLTRRTTSQNGDVPEADRDNASVAAEGRR